MTNMKQNHPVDTGWAWVIVLGYFISVFHMVGIAKSFGILLEEFVNYFNITYAMAALVMGVSGGVYTVSAPVCIAAGQHFTQRKVVMLGGLIGGLGLSLSGLLFSIEWVILTFGVLYGFGNACLFGNGLVIIGQYFNKRRSLANGLALSGASVGMFVIPPLLQYLLDNYSLKGTLVIIGAMYFNIIMCGSLFRPTNFYTRKSQTKDQHRETEDLIESEENGASKQIVQKQVGNNDNTTDTNGILEGENGAGNQLLRKVRYRTTSSGSVVIGSVDSLHTIAVDVDNQSKSNMEDRNHDKASKRNNCVQFLAGLLDFTVLRSFIVVMLVIVSFLLFVGHFNFILFMPSSAASRGVSKYNKAYLVSITGISDLVGRLLVGVAGDLQIIARYKLLAITTLLCGFSILGFTFATQYWVMGVFVGLYGFFGGCYVAINAPVVIDLVGLKSLPKVLGVVLFIQGLGAAIGQPVLGAIRDRLGSYLVVNLICFLSMVIGSTVLFMYPFFKRMEEGKKSPGQDPDENLEIVVS